jgi:Putative transposase
VIYTLLFRAAADTLLTFGRDPQHLGGTIGVTAILHTWGQTLTQHLHVHCLVTGGALSRDRARWIRGRAAFLFPVKALSIVFRAKYLAGLQRAFAEDRLTFAAGTAPLADVDQFAALVAQLRATPWVVYAKPPFGGPAQVLRYLGRYTHRIAISNARLLSLVDGVVQFRWKDYADRGRTKVMALGIDEFLRRFLLHVLPRGFVRIRHFGLLANAQRRATIASVRHLLGTTTPTPSSHDDVRSPDADRTRCPICRRGSWQVVEVLRPIAPRLAPLTADTS